MKKGTGQLKVALPSTLKKRIAAVAKGQSISSAALIRLAATEYVERHEQSVGTKK